MKFSFAAVAFAIPLIGLGLLVARAEFGQRSGTTWSVRIEGFDPRDLVRGHYLQFRYVWNFLGEDSCGPRQGSAASEVAAECCLCLDGQAGSEPQVRNVACDDVEPCDGWLVGREVLGPQKYFVDESRALELETRLREEGGSVRISTGPDGHPLPLGLELAGQTWP